MKPASRSSRVGEVRPSQTLVTFGVGAIIDLPNMATLVMGLEDWDGTYAQEIGEDRLLEAVRQVLGTQVESMRAAPHLLDGDLGGPYGQANDVGIPVATFPRWLVCPFCRRLAPVSSELFKLTIDPYRTDRSRYIHHNCTRKPPKPAAIPARFLVACQAGHLDDFPWVWYVHKGYATVCQAPRLKLHEFGVSGEAAEVTVECENCQARRSMAEAFGPDSALHHLNCSGRRPHLRDYSDKTCQEQHRAILLGASNFWFPVSVSALAIPSAHDALGRLVEQQWVTLSKVTNPDRLALLRELGHLPAFASVDNTELWEAIERHRGGGTLAESRKPGKLRTAEWRIFSDPDPDQETRDFRLRPVAPPAGYSEQISGVVLVERLREVRALLGFTRIVSPGDISETEEVPVDRRAPLSRQDPKWVPASEVRGEGIFIRFREEAIQAWEEQPALESWRAEFFQGHKAWRTSHHLVPAGSNFPGLRYVLLHSFSHALMRRLSLECGYTASSICERIYSLPPLDEDGPMAGVLIYTAAPDSEGTLGGLVSLGEPETLGRLLDLALEEAGLCSSDPLCAEHLPSQHSLTLHGAACHSCLFAPETACERGNKYLDRSLLVEPIFPQGRAFFSHS